MPKVTVLDMAGKEVSKIDLSDAVFGIGKQSCYARYGEKLSCKSASRHTIGPNPRRGFRWW